MIEVWSKTSDDTKPPLLQGETTSIGTRWPRPYGPGVPLLPPGVPPTPAKISSEASTVDAPSAAVIGAYGGTTWSKKPSFSSYVMNSAVLLHTSGLAVSASSTWATYQAP